MDATNKAEVCLNDQFISRYSLWREGERTTVGSLYLSLSRSVIQPFRETGPVGNFCQVRQPHIYT